MYTYNISREIIGRRGSKKSAKPLKLAAAHSKLISSPFLACENVAEGIAKPLIEYGVDQWVQG